MRYLRRVVVIELLTEEWVKAVVAYAVLVAVHDAARLPRQMAARATPCRWMP
jgi:hypothetical protein